MSETFYPTEENIGKNCEFWGLEADGVGCTYPKAGMQGRMMCLGTIDNVCLFLKDKRINGDFTDVELVELGDRYVVDGLPDELI